MLRLYLLAHAPTSAQRQLRFAADDDAIEPVDAAVGERVLARLGRLGAVWRGPERRAEMTAAALGLVARPCDDLGAWSVGGWAGQAVALIAERDPEALSAWRVDPDASPERGESLNQLMSRVGIWLGAQAQATPSGRALVIADPAVLRALLVHAIDAGPATFWKLEVAPLSLAVIQYADHAWRLKHMGLEGLA